MSTLPFLAIIFATQVFAGGTALRQEIRNGRPVIVEYSDELATQTTPPLPESSRSSGIGIMTIGSGITHEPNNTSDQATTITVDQVRRRACPHGVTAIDPTETGASTPDIDWYVFNAAAGDVFFAYLDTDRFGSALSANLDLLDSTLSVLQSAQSTNYSKQITFYTIPASGRYYLRVAGIDTSTGEYRLYSNKMPPEIRFFRTNIGLVEQLAFAAGGTYFYSMASGNELLGLYASAGEGTPVYSLIGVPNYSEIAAAEDSTLAVGLHLSSYYSDETWSYDGTNWTRMNPATAPAASSCASMTYDAARSEVVMFGGYRYRNPVSNETWTWNGTTWTKKNPATVPTASGESKMIYDSQRNRIVLYLMNATYNVPETWEWDGTNWTRKYTPHMPPAGYYFAFAFDSTRNVGVLFGPGNATTWEYDGTDWTQRAPATSPPYTFYDKSMAFDPSTGLCMLVTADAPCETWTWDGMNWTKLTPSTVIATRYKNLVYDTDRHRFVLICMDYNVIPSILRPDPLLTYEWNGSDWVFVSTAAAPENRQQMATAYDATHHRTVLNGGIPKLYVIPVDIERFQTPSSVITSTTHTSNLNVANGVRITPDGSRVFTARNQSIDVEDGAGNLIKRIHRAITITLGDITDDGSMISFKEGDWGIVYDVNRDKELFRAPNVPELDGDASRIVVINGRNLICYDRDGDDYRQIWSIPFNYESSLCNISANGSLVAASTQINFDYDANLGMVDYLVNGATGEILVEYKNARDPAVWLQNHIQQIAINRDGTLAAFADWGGDHAQHEFLVFSPKQGVPILQLPTPGSGMSVALKNNLLVMGTKAMHANSFGGGGEIYFCDLASAVSNTAPMVRNVNATPAASSPGSSVTFTAMVTDENGVGSVVANISSGDDAIANVALHDDGLSGDGAPGDGVYGAVYATDVTPRDYAVSITAADSLGRQALYPDVATFTTIPTPHVDVSAVTLYNTQLKYWGNDFGLTLTNNGTTTASAVKVKLVPQDPWIESISYNNGSPTLIGDIGAGQSRSSGNQYFTVYVNTSAPIGTIIHMGVLLTDAAGHEWTTSFDFPEWIGIQAFNVDGTISTTTPFIDQQVTFTATVRFAPGPLREVNAKVKNGDTGALIQSVPMYDDGLHNDGGAGDLVYGTSWTTPHTPGNFSVIFEAITVDWSGTSGGFTRFVTMAPFTAANRVLVINGSQTPSDPFAQAFLSSLTRLGVACDYWDVPFNGGTPQSVLDHYVDGAVIYELGWGEQPSDDQLFALQTYLDHGGNLIFSSPGGIDAHLLNSVLFNSYFETADGSDSIGLTQLTGNPSDPIGSGLTITTSYGAYNSNYKLGVLAHPCFNYVGGSAGVGLWRVDSSYKAIVMGFPFAEITSVTVADELLARMLNHFDPSLLPATSFGWTVPGSDHMQGVPFNVSLTALNRCGGTVTNFTGAVSLQAWTTVQIPMTPAAAGSFVGGTWNGTVTIPEAANGIHLVANGTSISGQSSTFNVVALSAVWVDFGYMGTELGTELQPFNTLAEGVASVQSGNTVYIKPGTSTATPRITRHVRLVAPTGGVRFGAGH
ncbi:hypothetical protein LLG95_18400 [bacterium]|nr:hypothetical protein [bacterium]